MGDNNYQTYEYLPASNAESEADQFFVVQEDGTYLTNRQVQYVAQVQDVKEVLQGVHPCTVYDMASQQFFVDIDNSSDQHQNNSLSTLVTLVRNQDDSTSASDQFIIPQESNLYGNSYLLQQMPSTTTEQMEVDNIKVDGLQDANSQAEDGQVALINKQSSDFTEVTLTDDQYNVLEQKGWVLLETNDRTYVLDTLGLHDITANDKLIQKLRHEIQDDEDVHMKLGNIKTENSSSANIENIIPENLSNEQSTIELVVEKKLQENSEITQGDVTFINNHKTAGEHKEQSIHQKKQSSKTVVGKLEHNIIPDSKAKNESRVHKQGHIIKIKTNFIFEDIPDKILLGKTTTGNNLIAKVEKNDNRRNNKTSKKNVNKITTEVKPTVYLNDTRMPEWQLFSAIHQCLWEKPRTRWRANDVLAAQTIISRLLELPDLKSFVMDHDLVITKIVENVGETNETQHENILALLTGRITQSDGESLQFNIIPDMLHKAIKSADSKTSSVTETAPQDKTVTKVNYEFLHIHILESRLSDNSEEQERVSVFLNKRNFPLNFSTNIKKRRLSKLFACSACAALFELESDLKEHQETECLDSNDVLTIDTDDTKNAGISSTMLGKEKVYSCDNCNAKFSKVGNCRRHMKTHLNRKNADTLGNRNSSDATAESEEKSLGGMYKCNMCSSSYYHAATLSKHIVTMHIKTKCSTKQESELVVDCHPVLSYD